MPRKRDLVVRPRRDRLPEHAGAGMTTREIALALGVSESNVRVTLTRALRRFYAELERRGIGREILRELEPVDGPGIDQGPVAAFASDR